ncbi:MAG: hypothetical protein MI919_34590, partial [Holophagales bacterium]|nr:hypothetical protein [Holophagales bacterium]
VELARRADVVVSDLRGVLPFFGAHLPSVIDARERLLRAGGCLIPEWDELWIQPVWAPEAHAGLLGGFDGARLGLDPPLDLGAARQMAAHHWCRVELTEASCVLPARSLGRLVYPELASPHFRGRAEWSPAEPGAETGSVGDATLHGLAVWFDAGLAGGVGFSNDPRCGKVLYGQAFFPFPEAVRTRPGDAFEAGLSAHLVGEDYVFGWQFRQLRQGEMVAEVDASTFRAAPLGAGELGDRVSARVPRPDGELEALSWLANAVDGESSLGGIAEQLVAAFPHRFDDEHSALAWAVDRLPGRGGEKARILLGSNGPEDAEGRV